MAVRDPEATRARLRAAALAVVREQGLAAASARTIAAHAGVNQALIFYHFDTVAALIAAASDEAVEATVANYRADLIAARSVPELLAVARTLHEQERSNGNVAFMAQLLAGAAHEATLAAAGQRALDAWAGAIAPALERALAATPLAGDLDPADLAHLISASFVGLELYAGVDPAGAEGALTTLDLLGELLQDATALGPLVSAAARLRRRSRKR